MINEENERVSAAVVKNDDLADGLVFSKLDEVDLDENPFVIILEKVMNVPGAKINRTAFLIETYGLNGTEVENENLSDLVSLEKMDNAATKFITTNVTWSSGVAFTLGLPGGLFMAASIPADVMQNFVFSLRLAQQLAYIYGFENLFAENDEMNDRTRHIFIAFFGIMFAATGSGSVLRVIAPNVGKYAAKQALTKPLTKTVWYPVLKKISTIVASKTVTKKGVSAFAAKAIPVVGGVVSAGINVATMLPMANRLKTELRKYHLSDEEIREIVEKENVAFSDKASDALSDVAAGSVKAFEKAKGIGIGFAKFAKDISDKTKEKIKQEAKPENGDSAK